MYKKDKYQPDRLLGLLLWRYCCFRGTCKGDLLPGLLTSAPHHLLSVLSAPPRLLHTWQSTESGLCLPWKAFVWARCACYPPWPLVSLTRGLRSLKGPGRRQTEPRGPRCWPRARSGPLSPVTVSPLSLTVCSQLDSFCPGVKAFSWRARRCQLGGRRGWHPYHNADVSPGLAPPPTLSHFAFECSWIALN